MKRLLLTVLILFLAIISLTVVYFKNTQPNSMVKPPMEAIPDDATIIVEVNKTEGIYFSSLADLLPGKLIDSVNWNELTTLKEIFLDNPELEEVFEDVDLYLSLHRFAPKKQGLLLVSSLKSVGEFDVLGLVFKSILKGKNRLESHNFQGVKVHDLLLTDINRTFSFCILNNLLVGSFETQLVEKSISHMEMDETLASKKDLITLKQLTSENFPVHLYLNHSVLSDLVEPIMRGSNRKLNRFLSQHLAISALDVTFKDNGMRLSGLALPVDSPGSYLTRFKDQKPVFIELIEILPNTISGFFHVGISEMSSFWDKGIAVAEKKGGAEKRKKEVQNLELKYKIALPDAIINTFGDEAAVFEINHETVNSLYGVVEIKDFEEASKFLATLKGNGFENSEDNETYLTYSIEKFPEPKLIEWVYGDLMDHLKNPYFISVNGYWIFNNSKDALKRYLDDYVGQELLSKDGNYKLFADNVSSDGNIYLFINMDGAKEKISKELMVDFRENIFENIFSNFYGLAFQLSANGEAFFTNLILEKKGKDRKIESLLWSLELKNGVSMEPSVVINHITGEKEIAVQDDGKNLYLISKDGNILWEAELKEQIIGKIQQIDFYKNQKLQLVFNTSNYIYIIDRNGYLLGNYPLKLKKESTSPLAIFDYEKNKNYRFFIGGKDNNIWGYRSNKKPLNGWSPKRGIGKLNFPISHSLVEGKDLIFAGTEGDRSYILNRRGEIINEINFPDGATFKNEFSLITAKTIKESYYASSSTQGDIFKVYLNGDLEKFAFGTWSKDHFFKLADVDGDKDQDFIFADKKELFVFKNDTSVLFNYQFRGDINQPPLLFKQQSGKNFLGITMPTENQIYLLREDGNIYDGFPLRGSSPFIIEDLGLKTGRNVIVGSGDKKLYIYQLN